MDEQALPGKGEPIEHTFLSGGSQNEIYELRRGALHCAMRIPPTTAPASRDDGIVREWRIIEALHGTDVPHTEAVAVCTDASVSVSNPGNWLRLNASNRVNTCCSAWYL